jgi:hypothetical protein
MRICEPPPGTGLKLLDARQEGPPHGPRRLRAIAVSARRPARRRTTSHLGEPSLPSPRVSPRTSLDLV